jgi:hypothetical protein
VKSTSDADADNSDDVQPTPDSDKFQILKSGDPAEKNSKTIWDPPNANLNKK